MTDQVVLSPQASGQTLEGILDFAHSTYWNRSKVWVRHNHIPGVWRSRGKGKKQFTPHPDKAAPDYYACVAGQFVAFDAKTTRNKIRWRLMRDSKHQYFRLKDLAAAGSISFFAIEHKLEEVLYLLRIRAGIDWQNDLPTMVFPGEEGTNLLVVPTAGGWYDWLGPVREKWL